METPPWASDSVPRDMPSPARMYDYFLGGVHHFPIDRAAAEAGLKYYPDLQRVAQVNRAFLQRAVAFLSRQGIDQFLDIGSGMPTAGNVHTIAQQSHPEARIAYVDIDPIAVMHSQAILHIEQVYNTIAIQGDVREPEMILNNADIQSLLDFTRPIGLLLVAVMHFVTDAEMSLNAIRTLQNALPAGSYVALSHVSSDPFTPQEVAEAEKFYSQTTTPIRFRSSAQIGEFFAGLDLVPPGLTYASSWHPNGPEDLWYDTPERSTVIVGVGHMPTRSV